MAHPYGIEFHGPVAVEPVFYPLIDGKRIPHVTLHPVRDDPEGDWALELDGRWLIVGTDSEIRKWLAFLANAMAVSAGYVCFGSDKRINPHNGPEHIGLSNGAYQALREE
jgi:hypothetical protein